MAAIFVASGAEEVAAPDMINVDKLGHAAVFGLLATAIARTQPPARRWIGALGASLYGLTDEFRQSFTPGRSVEVADWVADSAGALTAVLAYHCWGGYRRLLEFPVGWTARQIASAQEAVPEKAA